MCEQPDHQALRPALSYDSAARSCLRCHDALLPGASDPPNAGLPSCQPAQEAQVQSQARRQAWQHCSVPRRWRACGMCHNAPLAMRRQSCRTHAPRSRAAVAACCGAASTSAPPGCCFPLARAGRQRSRAISALDSLMVALHSLTKTVQLWAGRRIAPCRELRAVECLDPLALRLKECKGRGCTVAGQHTRTSHRPEKSELRKGVAAVRLACSCAVGATR